MKAFFTWVSSLFNLSKGTFIAVLIFIAVFITGFIVQCHADELPQPETRFVQVSAGSTVIRGIAPLIDIGFAFPSSFYAGDYWKADITMIGSSTFTQQNVSAPNNFIVRGLYVTGFRFFDIGIGLSWMQNYLPYNGGNVNLNLEAAYRFQRFPITLTYSHVSDAGTKLPNYGRDMLMVGYRF